MWNLKEVFISWEHFFLRTHDIFSYIQTVLFHSVCADAFLLFRIQVSERKRIKCSFDYRILELKYESVLFYSFRFCFNSHDSSSVFVFYVLSGTLAQDFSVRIHQLYFFCETVQHSECVCLHIVYIQIECIRLFLRIVNPDLETVLKDIELGDQILGWHSLDPYGIYLCVWSHKGNVRCSVSYTFLVYDHLLAWLLAENVQFIFLLSCQTIDSICHFIFQ